MNKLLLITMKPLKFYSNLDENSLIRNLESIKFVEKIIFIDSGLNILIDKNNCDWEGFKDILSLFLRYNVDLSLLGELAPTEEVKTWFFAPQREWHSRIHIQSTETPK